MHKFFSRRAVALAFIGGALLSAAGWAAVAPAPAKFTNPAIDLGVVCSDITASTKFYVEAIGLKPAGGFDVPTDMATYIGLADNKSWRIDVFAVGEGPNAAKLKLMQFKDEKPAKPDDSFLHSALGVRYITLVVPDLDVAMARASAAGVKPAGKGVAAIPGDIAKGLSIVVYRDPDGTFVELVGPRAAK